MMYVVGRLEPDHRSGCIYWSGSVTIDPGPADSATLLIGEAVTRHNVLVLGDADVASGLALWLNTSPALKRHPGAALWRAMPLPDFGGKA
ncbi:hypothetical protein MKI84_08365 [Ancylobacter sp. A5.8]|uniref:hypothetical protein n=1 Tax=Ancylobacter gelatini TaxID=2919920 RepID=UPI001F4D70DE|nr:hypothetical protein [Ancylobacter gelatini]MCJ8142928.1 hypothetical protein [Ancylobacter gelatini]